MKVIVSRSRIASMMGAVLLTIAVSTAAAARVATLAEPDSDAEATPDPIASDTDAGEALLDWAACMRENGIDMDDPQFGAGGGRLGFGAGAGDEGLACDPGSSDFQSAMETCGNVLEAKRPDLDVEQEAERAEQQLVLDGCMRDLGWDFPDPASGGASVPRSASSGRPASTRRIRGSRPTSPPASLSPAWALALPAQRVASRSSRPTSGLPVHYDPANKENQP